MRTERNVNINIRDNRGITTLAGFVVVVILTRLWWTGLLADIFAAAYSPQGDGMGSATYMIVAFIANLIYGIGTVVVMVWSGLWWLVADVISAIRMYAAERTAKNDASETLLETEIVEGVNENPLIEILQTIEGNMQAIVDRIEEIDARVSMAEEALTSPKPKTNRAKS